MSNRATAGAPRSRPRANDPRLVSTSPSKLHLTGPKALQPLKIWRPDVFKTHPAKREHTIRRCVCLNVVDGDTFDVWVENGLEEMPYKRIRLSAVDAPSIEPDASEAERTLGLKAKARVEELILGKGVVCNFGAESQIYGRFIASTTYYVAKLPNDLAGLLIAEHLTVADVQR
jgi:endonuclease YncB( thermonuclease family)